MLRILRDDVTAGQVNLSLQGRIAGEWVDLLERECLELSRSGLGVVLDLSDVTFVGRSGLGALVRLCRTGIRVVGCQPLVADMLEQEGIEVSRNTSDTGDGKSPRKS